MASQEFTASPGTFTPDEIALAVARLRELADGIERGVEELVVFTDSHKLIEIEPTPPNEHGKQFRQYRSSGMIEHQIIVRRAPSEPARETATDSQQ